MKYFVVVVDCNSSTETAEQCFISQSAISQQVQALEEELGVELIHRENRRFSLVPAGEYFYRQSKILFDEMDELRREITRIGKAGGSRLRIGYSKSYSGWELHMTVAEFSGLHPETSTDIVVRIHGELYNRIRSGRVDIIISDQRQAFSEEYENWILLGCECSAEISSNHHPSTNECLILKELRQTPCILITPAGQRDGETVYYRDTLGFVGKFFYTDNLREDRLMVLGDRGFLSLENIGTMPPVMLAIRRIPLYRGDIPVKRTVYVFWPKKNTNYYIEELADILHHLSERSRTSQFRQQRYIKLFDRRIKLQSLL